MEKFSLGYIAPQTLEELKKFLKACPGRVTLNINSPGGDLSVALKMCTLLKREAKKRKIIGIVQEKADSSALLVLQCCSLRKASKKATFLFHPARKKITISFDATAPRAKILKIIEQAWKKTRRLQRRANKILSEKTGSGIKWLTRISKQKYRLAAEEARALGFIDKIIRKRKT